MVKIANFALCVFFFFTTMKKKKGKENSGCHITLMTATISVVSLMCQQTAKIRVKDRMSLVWTILPLGKSNAESRAKLIPGPHLFNIHVTAFIHFPAPTTGSNNGGCPCAIMTNSNAILYSPDTKSKQVAKHLLH